MIRNPVGRATTTVLLLNWNGWRDTVECLESLQNSSYGAVEVVVLDNGSSDGSLEQITHWAATRSDPLAVVRYTRAQAEAGGDNERERATFGELPNRRRLFLIDNHENLGFAAGNNVGIRFAIQRGNEYVFLLNNDTVVEPEAIRCLVQLLKTEPGLAGATAAIRYYGADIIWNCGGELTWYGSRRYHFHGRPAAEVPQSGWRRISFITGCAAMFPIAILRRVGLLTEQFFFGEEDYELSLRLRKQGLVLACCYDAVVRHKVGSSIRRSTDQKVLRSSYIYHLSRGIDLRQHWNPIRWQLWRQWSMLYVLPMLWLRYRISWRELWRLRSRLMRDTKRLHSVDKATFERAMQGIFDP